MRNYSLMAVVLAASAMVASPALAQTLNFTGIYHSDDLSVTDILNITTSDVLNTNGGYDIIGVTGTVGGDMITGLVSNPNQPGSSIDIHGVFIFDQNLFLGDPHFSNPGLLISTASNIVNLFSISSTVYEQESWNNTVGYNNDSHGTFMLTAVPEPASWALMLGGFGAIGGTLRSRKRSIVLSFG